MNFTLDEQYFCSVHKTRVTSLLKNPENPTKDDLIKILKGEDKMTSYWDEDHPEFSRLRNELAELGYIQISLSGWNGDRVLKQFIFNNAKFKIGEMFPCAPAMKGHLKYMKA